jgi:hypothetical protein
MMEGEMIWMIVSLLFVLCVIFIMRLLVIGKMADHKMESLFIDTLDNLQAVHTFSSLPPHTRAKLRTDAQGAATLMYVASRHGA